MHQSAQIAPIESKREDGKGHRQREFASEVAEVTGAGMVGGFFDSRFGLLDGPL